MRFSNKRFRVFAITAVCVFCGVSTADEPLDPIALWIKLKNEVELSKAMEGTHGPAAFGHLMGYSAGYYGYMWSKMLAMDMYEYFRDNGGLLSPKQGIRFRDIILSQGGSRHPDELVEEFLGRKPKIDALLRHCGIDA